MAGSIGNVVTVDNTSNGVGSTVVTIPTPSHNAGDVLVYIIVRNGSGVSSAPSDVDLAVGGNTSTTPTDWWYMRTGTGTSNEPASRSWTFSQVRTTAATCFVVQGVVYPTGLQSKQGSAYSNAPSITTLSSNTTNAFALALCISNLAAFPPESRTDTAVIDVVSGGNTQSCGFDLQSAQLPTVGTTQSMGWDLVGSGNYSIAMTSVIFQSIGSDTRPVITTSATGGQIVAPGSTVTLIATASDPDAGDSIASYSWALADSTADSSLITITSPSNATTTVTVPNYEAAFTFVCTVTDNSGISTSSAIGLCALNAAYNSGKLYVKNLDGSLTQIS